MFVNVTWRALAALGLSFALTACIGGGSTSKDEVDGGAGGAGGSMGSGGDDASCVPGRSEVCACPGGAEGVQVCEDDGTYADCACPPVDDAGAGEDDAGAAACADGDVTTEACGEGGERTRRCQDGAWGEWGPCEGGPCDGDATETRACGFNDRGESVRACVEGAWAPWSECDDPDICADGDTEDGGCGLAGTGTRQRACEEGQWGEWGECVDNAECVDGATERRACGLNGTGRQDRVCADGQWGDWGECDDPDECIEEQTEDDACGVEGNGTRSRVCVGGLWGAFGPCDDPDRACEPGSREEVPCGLNRRGRQAHDCGEDGRWGPFDACADPDVCVEDGTLTRACGLNGNGVETQTCLEGQWGAWGACDDDDECVNDQMQGQRCGLNLRGAQQRVCAAGRWGAFNECDDPDVCTDGDVENEACPDDDDRTRRCLRGQWDAWTECGARPVCPDPENPTCPGPRPERCNGIDDDADGAIDEGLIEPGEPDGEPIVLSPFVEDANASLARGLDWLRAEIDADGNIGENAAGRHHGLALLALLGQRDQGVVGSELGYAGLDAADQGLVQRLLANMIDNNAALRQAGQSAYTYTTGTDIGALTWYLASGGPDDVGAQVGVGAALQNGADALMSQQGEQAPDNLGGWNYNAPGPQADISTTHFVVSGLAAAAMLVDGAEDAVEGVAPVLRRNAEATEDGGFAYRNTDGSDSSTSMTAAAVWMHLLVGTPTDDDDVAAGLQWLADNYSPDSMVGPFSPTSTFYSMWTQTKVYEATGGEIVDLLPGQLDPAAVGYADAQAGWYFDFAITLMGWQAADGRWGNQFNESPRGWDEASSHLFALLTLQRTLGLVPVAPVGGPPACADGRDNDGDGLADDEDPDCVLACRPTERPRPACDNYADDDGDGRADWPDDPGCSHPTDEDESSPDCSDGRDNDGDGRADFPADPGCAGIRDGDESDPDVLPACGNGEDDDGDGAIDFPDDPECLTARQDAESFEGRCGDAVVAGAIPVGDSRLVGDTGDGENALAGTCGGVAGREVVYVLFTDGPERVTLSTIDDDTEVDTVLYVRGDCDGDEELACGDDVGDDPRSSISVDIPEAGTWFVVVDARIGRGQFVLLVSRTPAGGVGVPACVDGRDNDGDGRVDLRDPGCEAADDPDEADPAELPACSNRVDDDGDGAVDNEDPGCSAAGDDDEADPARPPACSNEIDDDADGATDWPADRSCFGPGGESEYGSLVSACTNRDDDDGDGVIDFPDDPGCAGPADDNEYNPPPECANGRDDDGDGRVDFAADPGCEDRSDDDESNGDQPACANGIDDDDDGDIDFGFDRGCASPQDDDEANGDGLPACANGRDDDFDGDVDWPADRQCTSRADIDERGAARAPQCGDGIDNDEDGDVDLADVGCEGLDDDDEGDAAAEGAECADGEDNDRDGDVDWPADTDCNAAGAECEQAGAGLCDGVCIDLEEDPDNCGACGFTCRVGEACVAGNCGGLYQFEGILQDIPAQEVVGWDVCYTGLYADEPLLDDALGPCDGELVMYGCRPVGADTWTLLAMGEREAVFTDTGAGNELNVHNGVGWYFSRNASIGFAPPGATVTRNTCDVQTATFNDQRMCWHTRNDDERGEILRTGWRCGATRTLNFSQAWERTIFTAR
jgi:hypothetical protein